VPDPTTLKALADAGGLVLFIGVVLLIAIGAIRQWWVPGWLYQQERADRVKAEIQAQRGIEAVEGLTRFLKRQKAGPSVPS